MIAKHIPEYPFNNTSEGIVNAQEDKSTPKLEALVRESLQNSLDATNGFEEVCVEFDFKEYDVIGLNNIFPELSSVLGPQPNNFLSIRDSGTVGLTGDVDDKKSNYCGLVKKIGQTGKDAGTMGGSWGKGKSVFYRQGIGFVIFYSRIRNNDSYESRMNAVFANWKNLDFVPIKNWSGISIWGGDELNENDVTPITDDDEIDKVLSCFGIRSYKGEETGTLVIIPSVSKSELLNDVEDGTEHDSDKSWLTTVERCLDFYIQKWFSPRLNNRVEGKPVLRCSVNSEQVFLKYRFFTVLQKLYNDTFDSSLKNVINLPLKNQNKSYGNLAWGIFSSESLKDVVDHDPYKLCDMHEVSEKGNRPIVTYVRSPGMFLTFEEPALSNLPETESGSYLVAVFRLNPDTGTTVKLKSNEELTLEQYVRSTEKSNHRGWKDISSSSDRFVSNIMSQITKKLSDQMRSGESTKVSGRRSTDGRFVADRLFPEGGSYIQALRSKGTTTPSKGKQSKRSSPDLRFTPLSEAQTPEGVLKTGLLQFSNATSALVRLGAFAESTTYFKESWDKDIGTPFPLSFLKLSVLSYTDDNGTEIPCDVRTTLNCTKANGDRLTVRWKDYSEIRIGSGRPNTIMRIEFLVKRSNDLPVIPELDISTIGVEHE